MCGDRWWGRKKHRADDYDLLYETLDDLHALVDIDVLINGMAPGADRMAARWAMERGIPRHHFPPHWNRYGRGAGMIRNRAMLERGKPDMVIAFHRSFNTSKGTKHMVLIARAAGVPTDVRGGRL